MKKIIICIFAVMFLTSCATQKAYQGKERNDEELSIISPPSVLSSTGRAALGIIEVDGIKLNKLKSGSFKVLPGSHTIKINLVSVVAGGNMQNSQPIEISFVTEAGKKYIVEYKVSEDSKPIYYVIEENSGKVIYEKKN